MVFKLVNVECVEGNKIVLNNGTLVFGKGKLLNVDDKRVSRNHGQLEVNDKLYIKALHVNPCFYLKKNSKEVGVLKCDDQIELCMGDRFGLLPNTHWFEVIVCDETSQNGISNDNVEKTKNSNAIEQNTCIEEDMDSGEIAEQTTIVPSEPNEQDETNEAVISEAETDFEESPNVTAANESQKRPTEDEEIANKRVKCEPADVKQEPDGEQPGSSTDNVNTNNDVKTMPPSPQKPGVARERCYYGEQCYRQNPQHRAQFSHPRDPDWGAGERGECPFGLSCSKPDPRHWETHNHPPGANRPAQRGKRKKKRQSISSDESVPEDLIIDGKRKRKVIQRDVWSSGSENEDPYGTDESDEWQPSGKTQDYSQDD